jgi:hypothetical protein
VANYYAAESVVVGFCLGSINEASRAMNEGPVKPSVTQFLRDALADTALSVPKLEAMARAAGLLGEGQRITHAKVFKRASYFAFSYG